EAFCFWLGVALPSRARRRSRIMCPFLRVKQWGGSAPRGGLRRPPPRPRPAARSSAPQLRRHLPEICRPSPPSWAHPGPHPTRSIRLVPPKGGPGGRQNRGGQRSERRGRRFEREGRGSWCSPFLRLLFLLNVKEV